MAKVSLSEAARISGKGRATIHRHIANGVLTKEVSGTGAPVIDLAELERVYGPLRHEPVRDKPKDKPRDKAGDKTEIQGLREQIAHLEGAQREHGLYREERERERRELSEQIDDLRRRLDTEAEERRKLTAILTDQRTKAADPEPAPAHTPPPPKGLRGWLHRLTG